MLENFKNENAAEWTNVVLTILITIFVGFSYYIKSEIQLTNQNLNNEVTIIKNTMANSKEVYEIINRMDNRLTIIETNQKQFVLLVDEIKGLRQDITEIKVKLASKK